MRRYMPAVIVSAIVLLARVWSAGAADVPAGRIALHPRDFVSTRWMDEANQTLVRTGNVLRGGGEATYAAEVPQAGWYELWIAAAGWPTDVLLDGKLLINTTFASDVWPMVTPDTFKVVNVYLTPGRHTLSIRARSGPGLPY